MTNWTYTYHRFADQDEFLIAAFDAGAFYVDGVLYFPDNVVVDDIGALSTSAMIDEEGNEVVTATSLPGYHVNCAWRGDVDPAFVPYQITPISPLRKFAT